MILECESEPRKEKPCGAFFVYIGGTPQITLIDTDYWEGMKRRLRKLTQRVGERESMGKEKDLGNVVGLRCAPYHPALKGTPPPPKEGNGDSRSADL